MVLLNGHIYAGHQQNEGFPTCLNMATGDIVSGQRNPQSRKEISGDPVD